MAATGIWNTFLLEFSIDCLVASVILIRKYFRGFWQNDIQESFKNGWCPDLKLENRRVRHRSRNWREEGHTERQHILHIWCSSPGRTTRAEHRRAHLHRSAPLTRTFLAATSTVKVSISSIFHLEVASEAKEEIWRRLLHTHPCSSRQSRVARCRARVCVFLSQPHFDLSSRCQLAAMFVYSAREATCVIASNEVTCFDLSWNLIPGRDEDVETGLRLRIWKCESGRGWD